MATNLDKQMYISAVCSYVFNYLRNDNSSVTIISGTCSQLFLVAFGDIWSLVNILYNYFVQNIIFPVRLALLLSLICVTFVLNTQPLAHPSFAQNRTSTYTVYILLIAYWM